MVQIESLPFEILLEILKQTDGVTLARCRRVCTIWKECIDGTDTVWHDICMKEFKYSSKIAKQKAGNDCNWYHIYRNLKMWPQVSASNINLKEFYNFTTHDKNHAIDIDYNILPLRDKRGVVMYDMTSRKYIPVSVPDKNCLKIANNDYATVILLKSGMFIQKSVEDVNHMSEAFFKADDFVLSGDTIYFYNNRDIYKCNLLLDNLSSELIVHCDYDIKVIQYDSAIRTIHIFTDCGKIVNVKKDKTTELRDIKVPPEWIKHIKYISAINDRNFICYSRNLFKIETDKYQHTYLDFPQISALFFYGDIVLIGTRAGDVIMYRLSNQKRTNTPPIYEHLVKLPDDKIAVHLDVCEKKSGPIIVVATYFDIYFLNVTMFPQVSTLYDNKFKIICR